MSSHPKVIATGKLFEKFECFVLDGGNRCLSKAALVRILTGDRAEASHLDRYLAALPSRYKHLATGINVAFIQPQGGIGHAVHGDTAVAICSAYVEAMNAGELRKNQLHLARNAAGLIIAAARTGIRAAIDEATGYDAVRERGELLKIFRDSLGAWESTFTADLVQSLCRLGVAGERYRDWKHGAYPRPLAAAFHRIYSLILGPGAKRELKKLNPEPRRGQNHHQWLTPEAHDLLSKNMGIIRFCARTSSSATEFWERLTDHYAGQSRLVYVA